MGLSDSILKATEAHNALSNRRYVPDMQRAARDLAQYQALIGGAEADYAPQYFQGRADTATNQAGLLGEELKYAPQMHSLRNQLLQAQIGSANRANPLGADAPHSAFGKLQSDYFNIVDKYGADSPQAKQFSAYMSKQLGGAGGMFYDPQTGQPLQSTGAGGGGSRGGGGVFINPETGEITGQLTGPAKTRDQRTIAGADNVKDYLQTAQSTLPKFMTLYDMAKVNLQKGANLLGANYEGPSIQAEGEASITTMAEGFINTFGLNATDENVKKAEKIFKPRLGESPQAWLKRTERQGQEFIRVQKRAQERQMHGNRLGYTNASLQQQAQAAIAAGADPELVQEQLSSLTG